jgi:glycerol kinase
MKKYLLAIDQGTTSSRALVYDETFSIIGQGQHPFPQHYPKADWVEHDLEEIWSSVVRSVQDALRQAEASGVRASDIQGIGITNQRETFGVWRKGTGETPVRAIVWQCRRSALICEKLRKSAAGRKLAQGAGLVLDPYFSGTKLKWLLDERKDLRAAAKKGELLFGTIDTWLIWKLSSGAAHVTDTSNASRTLLMDLRKVSWNPASLKTLSVPAEMLPEIRDSNARFAETRGLAFLPDGVPIHGVLGDQQAALLGQECLKPGEAKVTYGTGAFMLLNTGAKVKKSRHGVSTVAWTVNGKTSYAVEGSVFIAGAAVQWLRDELGLVKKSSEIEALAQTVKDSDGVFFIPALSGLGSPYWAPHARGLLGGLTRRSSKAHIARAAIEGIAASIGDLAEGLAKDAGLRLKHIKADGGASANGLLLQSQANLLRATLLRPQDLETTVRGAAYVCALGLGWFKSLEEVRGKNPIAAEFKPSCTPAQTRSLLVVWRRRVKGMLAGAY